MRQFGNEAIWRWGN